MSGGDTRRWSQALRGNILSEAAGGIAYEAAVLKAVAKLNTSHQINNASLMMACWNYLSRNIGAYWRPSGGKPYQNGLRVKLKYGVKREDSQARGKLASIAYMPSSCVAWIIKLINIAWSDMREMKGKCDKTIYRESRYAIYQRRNSAGKESNFALYVPVYNRLRMARETNL